MQMNYLFLANTPAQAKYLLYSLEQAAQNTVLYVNSNKIEFMCFNQYAAISTLNSSICLLTGIHKQVELIKAIEFYEHFNGRQHLILLFPYSFISLERRLVLMFVPWSCFPSTLMRCAQSCYTKNNLSQQNLDAQLSSTLNNPVCSLW